MPAVHPSYRAVKTAAPVVAAGGGTTVLALDTTAATMLTFYMDIAVADLTGFAIDVRVHPDADWITLFGLAADFNNPLGDLIAASGDLTTQAAASAGWFEMIVSGWESVRLVATSAGTATVSAFACLK